MKWANALLTTLGIIVIIWLCFSLGVTSLAFSWVLNFILMGWFTIVESQLKPPLNSPYFNSFPFERKGRIYEMFGVHAFRWLLRASGWDKIIKAERPVKKTLLALEKFDHTTRVSEIGHAIVALIVFAFTVFVSFKYSVLKASWLILFNIVLNIYPIMLQRYNRPRLRRLIQRLHAVSER